jgi:hypothetical protein
MQTNLPLLRSVRRDVTWWRRTPAFGGNEKLEIHIKLQTIYFLATCLHVSKNVNRSTYTTGILLYVQDKSVSHSTISF